MKLPAGVVPIKRTIPLWILLTRIWCENAKIVGGHIRTVAWYVPHKNSRPPRAGHRCQRQPTAAKPPPTAKFELFLVSNYYRPISRAKTIPSSHPLSVPVILVSSFLHRVNRMCEHFPLALWLRFMLCKYPASFFSSFFGCVGVCVVKKYHQL